MKVVRSSLLLAIIVGVSLLLVSSPDGLAQGCLNPVTTAGSTSCDGSLGAFTLTLTDVVGITVAGAVTNATIVRSALNNRFLPLTSTATVDIFSVTNYQVFGSVAITGGTTSGLLPDALLQTDITLPATDDGGDDPVDVTAGTCTNAVITSATNGAVCTALSSVGPQVTQLWTGGNTEGGSLTSQQIGVKFRIDKDALGNASTGTAPLSVFNFVVTFRVLEV